MTTQNLQSAYENFYKVKYFELLMISSRIPLSRIEYNQLI